MTIVAPSEDATVRPRGSISLPTVIVLLLALAAASYFVVLLVKPDDQEPEIPARPEPVVETRDTPVKPKDEPAKPIAAQGDQTASANVVPQGSRGEPTEVAGFVRDVDGRPVGGATVHILDYTDYDRTSLNKRHLERLVPKIKEETTSGPDGHYRFKGQTPGHKLYVRAQAPGFISQIKDAVGVGLLADFNLLPGVRAEGRVIDADTGAPIANATVRGWYKTGAGVTDVNQLYRWEERVTTDAAGKYAFEGIPAETVLFMLWHDDYEDFREERLVARGSTNTFEFKMKKGLVLEGVVLNKMDGTPVPSVLVRVSNFIIPRHTVKCDNEGRFRVTGVERGDQSFMFSREGFSDYREPRKITDSDNYDSVKDNKLVFRLDPTGSAAGRVVSPDGVPADNARVFVALQNPLTRTVRGLAEATTDKDGRYLVKNLNANATYVLAAHKPGTAIGTSEPIVVGPNEIKDGMDITLRRGAGISGVVSNEASAPIAGAVITAEIPPFADVWFPPGMDLGQPTTRTIVTGPDGRFELTDLWKGSFTFGIEHPEHVALTQQKVVIKESDQQITNDFTMKIGRFISGSVFALDGRPAEGATVSASKPWSDRPEGTATVDQRGQYRISGLVKGNYRVQARKEGASSKAVNEVPSDSESVNFTLVENGLVTGVVLSPDGVPEAEFMVTLIPLDEVPGRPPTPSSRRAIPQSFSDPGGRFAMENVEPGLYNVVASSAQNGRVEKTDVQVPGGGPVDVGVLQLPRGGVIRGRLTDVAGAPLFDVTVTAVNTGLQAAGKEKGDPKVVGKDPKDPTGEQPDTGAGTQSTWTARPGASGDYVIAGLPAGSYTLTYSAVRHIAPPPENLTLEAGQEVQRDHQLPLASQIVLTVIDDFNEPVVAALAQVREALTGRRLGDLGPSPRSDAQGKITLPNVPPGKYLVTVNRPGYLIKEEPVEVPEGQTVQRTFQIEKIR